MCVVFSSFINTTRLQSNMQHETFHLLPHSSMRTIPSNTNGGNNPTSTTSNEATFIYIFHHLNSSRKHMQSSYHLLEALKNIITCTRIMKHKTSSLWIVMRIMSRTQQYLKWFHMQWHPLHNLLFSWSCNVKQMAY